MSLSGVTPVDPQYMIRGQDGELWSPDGNIFLAQVPRFQAQIQFKNTVEKRARAIVDATVMHNIEITLMFEETVICDDFITSIMAQVSEGTQPEFTFQGRLIARQAGATNGVYTFTRVTPDGNMTLLDVQQGQVLKRTLNWKCNEYPTLVSRLRNPGINGNKNDLFAIPAGLNGWQ